jgi:hypothetical protein
MPDPFYLGVSQCPMSAFRGQGGHSVSAAAMLANDPMYGPAVRRKRVSSIWRMRSCINVSGLWLERIVLPAIMDISARAISLADRPRSGPFGSPVFACAGKTEPPSRLILSQTSVS